MRVFLDNCKIRPKRRPRVGKKTVSPTKKHEETLALLMKDQLNRTSPTWKTLESTDLHIDMTIFSSKKFRGDVDNYAKTVLDAVQKAQMVHNDKQFKKLSVELSKTDFDGLRLYISKIKCVKDRYVL